jgi:hypothetical protein
MLTPLKIGGVLYWRWMTISIDDAKWILEAHKRLIGIREWEMKPDKGRTSVVSTFEARIEINGTMPRGVWLRALVRPRYMDSATFQLECDLPGSRSHLPLYRLDWRPLSIHVNGNRGPEHLRGLMFGAGESHEHICLDHAIEHEGRIRAGGVQTATKIYPDFASYQDALAYVCGKLRLVNCADIPPVRDLGSLF